MKDRLDRLLTPYGAAGTGAAGSFALLAGAHAFERIGGLAPCMLCLDQREAHWLALGAALITLGVHHFWRFRRAVTAGLGVTALIYLFSTVLAAYHAGVEWKFWPGPATCSATETRTFGSAAELMDALQTAPIVSCSDAAWRLFGVSMAGYNALVSLALAAITAFAAARLVRAIRADGFAASAAPTR